MVAAILFFPGLARGQAGGPPDRWIAPDKALHVAGGFDAAAMGYAACAARDCQTDDRRIAAITAGLAAGLAKEAYDRLVQREPWSWKDLVADGVGIALLVSVTAAAEP